MTDDRAQYRQCAFCGFDGQLGGATVGVEAAHVQWFNFDGPDDLSNGLALCSLHHKLFDRGALGLDTSMPVVVSAQHLHATGPRKAGRWVLDIAKSVGSSVAAAAIKAAAGLS